MGESVNSMARGPVKSRTIRWLFYLGESLMLAGVLLAVVHTVVLSQSEWFLGFEGGGFILLLLIFIMVTYRNTWSIRDENESTEQPEAYEEWVAIRQWHWTILLAVLIAGGFTGLIMIWWGSEWFVFNDLSLIVLGIGLLLRMAGRWQSEP